MVGTLRCEVLHHGGGVETTGGGDTEMQGLAPWGWELKLQVVGTLRCKVLHHGGEG